MPRSRCRNAWPIASGSAERRIAHEHHQAIRRLAIRIELDIGHRAVLHEGSVGHFFVDTVADVNDNDFEQARFLYVKSKGAFYRINLGSNASDDGDQVLAPYGMLGPSARRVVRKSAITARLIQAGKMEAAHGALMSEPVNFARWIAADRPEIYAGDPLRWRCSPRSGRMRK